MNKRCVELLDRCKDYLSAYDNDELSQSVLVVEALEVRNGNTCYRNNEVLALDALYSKLTQEGDSMPTDELPSEELPTENYVPVYGMIRNIKGRWGSSNDDFKMTFPMLGECVRHFTTHQKSLIKNTIEHKL